MGGEMDLSSETPTCAGRGRLAGAVIAGKYRLDELLGEGSQGSVWKAYNLDLDLPVAVKVMHPLTDAGLAMAPKRLFREARAAATLGHPGIVRIFDFGRTPEGLPYLSMELLQGVSLAQHLHESGRLSPETSVRLVLAVADALSAAHAQGIVHRDVKPDNILLSICAGRMQPKLLDFGIARVADGQHLTQAGSVIGTPNYLPPEQARGLEDIDERADIWALCATLYECVTGVVPFAAATVIDVLLRIIEDEPQPIAAYGVDDSELWDLINKGLSKEPDDRWSSMGEFASAASQWLLARGFRSDICGVAVESRWLRRDVASRSGETIKESDAWAHEPASEASPVASKRTRGALAASAALLCVAATVGVTRAGAWVFPDRPNESPAVSQPVVGPAQGAERVPPGSDAPKPVSEGVSNPDVAQVPDLAHGRDVVEEMNATVTVSETPQAASTPRASGPVVAPTPKTSVATTSVRVLPKAPVRSLEAPKTAAKARAADHLDLMDPY
jgi:serine/threonine-protein kinase